VGGILGLKKLCSAGPQIIASLGSPAAGSREQGAGSWPISMPVAKMGNLKTEN